MLVPGGGGEEALADNPSLRSMGFSVTPTLAWTNTGGAAYVWRTRSRADTSKQAMMHEARSGRSEDAVGLRQIRRKKQRTERFSLWFNCGADLSLCQAQSWEAQSLFAIELENIEDGETDSAQVHSTSVEKHKQKQKKDFQISRNADKNKMLFYFYSNLIPQDI